MRARTVQCVQPGLRIQRVDLAVLAGDEQPPAGERRLRARRVHAGVAERPLQLQPRQVGGREPARFRVARVVDAVAPAVPAGPGRGVRDRRRRAAAVHDHRRRGRRHAAAGQELGDGLLLVVAQRDRLHLHAAVGHRRDDGFGCQLPQRLGSRRLLAGRGLRVAVGAVGLVERLAVRRRLRACDRHATARNRPDNRNFVLTPTPCRTDQRLTTNCRRPAGRRAPTGYDTRRMAGTNCGGCRAPGRSRGGGPGGVSAGRTALRSQRHGVARGRGDTHLLRLPPAHRRSDGRDDHALRGPRRPSAAGRRAGRAGGLRAGDHQRGWLRHRPPGTALRERRTRPADGAPAGAVASGHGARAGAGRPRRAGSGLHADGLDRRNA